MGTKAGWGITLLGALMVLLGVAMMVVLGPDSRVTSGPHNVDTNGIAVVTAPKTISWTGVQMTVLAELPVNKPVFVGLGNAVDVDNYIKDTERLEVDEFHRPWKVHTRTIKGEENLPAAPTALDWWLEDSAGLGGASIDVTLPDQTVSLAILSVGFSNLKGLKVTVAYGVKGGFAKGSGLALFGIGGIWLGSLLRRGHEFWREEEYEDDDDLGDEEFDDVVYVYIDEHGVEHEISANEAADYDVEDVVVEEYVVDDGGDEVGELPATEPDPEPEPDPDPEPEPEPAPPAKAEPVTYVFVDEDGVEHEVTEDELGDYEIVDDDDEEDRP